METVSIPSQLEDWNISLLDELLKYPGIESTSLDFKKKPNDLPEHFCAMANTEGGFLILGIEEMKSKDGTKLLGYKKIGFNHGKQEGINQLIRNAISLLDPIPTIKFSHLPFHKKFLTIIEIKNETSKKPFFIKETGQCYVRIQDSTQIANRSSILLLFSASASKRNQIEKLRSVTSLLKESFQHTISDIPYGITAPVPISTVDLSLMKDAVSSCEWFFSENNLWGKHTSQSGYEVGINSILHNLESMNTVIHLFDQAEDSHVKQLWRGQLSSSYNLGGDFEEKIIEFLDKIISLSEDFLAKYQ